MKDNANKGSILKIILFCIFYCNDQKNKAKSTRQDIGSVEREQEKENNLWEDDGSVDYGQFQSEIKKEQTDLQR